MLPFSTFEPYPQPAAARRNRPVERTRRGRREWVMDMGLSPRVEGDVEDRLYAPTVAIAIQGDGRAALRVWLPEARFGIPPSPTVPPPTPFLRAWSLRRNGVGARPGAPSSRKQRADGWDESRNADSDSDYRGL